MLEKLNKIAPWAAMAVLGYLTYSTLDFSPIKAVQGKDLPPITQQMLRPTLIAASPHASPVDRDPFKVAWALQAPSGLELEAGSTTLPATAPATGPAVLGEEEPLVAEPPPLPGHLQGVLVGDGFQIAIIDDKFYKPGDTVGGTDPARSWRVETIGSDRVVLSFGEARETIRLIDAAKGAAGPAGAKRESP